MGIILGIFFSFLALKVVNKTSESLK